MFEACDRLGAFSDKLKLWKRRVQRGQLKHFHNFKNLIDAESIECTFQSVIIEDIDILLAWWKWSERRKQEIVRITKIGNSSNYCVARPWI